MPLTGTFYTAKELRDLLQVSKQRVANMAHEQRWESPYPGLYWAEGVEKYLRERARSQLYKEFGLIANNRPVDDDTFDKRDGCPECGAFASFDPRHPAAWRCQNGHSGQIG